MCTRNSIPWPMVPLPPLDNAFGGRILRVTVEVK
jgi:hypothetical protein